MNLKEKILKYQFYIVSGLGLTIILVSLVMILFFSSTEFRNVLHKDFYISFIFLLISIALSYKLFLLRIEKPLTRAKEYLFFLSLVLVFVFLFALGTFKVSKGLLDWFDKTKTIEGTLVYYKKDPQTLKYVFKIDTCPQVWVDEMNDVNDESATPGIKKAIYCDVIVTYYKRSKRVYSVGLSENYILYKDDKTFKPAFD